MAHNAAFSRRLAGCPEYLWKVSKVPSPLVDDNEFMENHIFDYAEALFKNNRKWISFA